MTEAGHWCTVYPQILYVCLVLIFTDTINYFTLFFRLTTDHFTTSGVCRDSIGGFGKWDYLEQRLFLKEEIHTLLISPHVCPPPEETQGPTFDKRFFKKLTLRLRSSTKHKHTCRNFSCKTSLFISS